MQHFQEAGVSTKIRAGYKGESLELDGFWIEPEGVWAGFRVLKNRYWNAFGIGLRASNSISCEINFPIEGKSQRIAGVLAKDEDGRVWVLHRGIIGGGKLGVSRALFEMHYKGAWKNAEGDPFAVVAILGQPDLVKRVADFVRLVNTIKASL